MEKKFDILIIGGGLIGNSLACALSGHGLTLGIVEARTSSNLSYDDGRTIALSHGSNKIFDTLGISVDSTPIREIHVSDRGHFGKTRLRASDYDVDALGYVVGINPLSRALLNAVDGVETICPAVVENIVSSDSGSVLTVVVDGVQKTIHSKLIIAADGANSSIGKLLNIDSTVWDYNQHAIVANVELNREHHFIAYERFTDLGPLAMLPLAGDNVAMVWAVKNELLDEILSLSDEAFLSRLQETFGYRLGRLRSISHRNKFPLKLISSKKQIAPGVVFVGNAAQSLHPFAAQGFNIGLRDVASIAEVVIAAQKEGREFWSDDVLRKYETWRKKDRRELIAFSDGVTRLFSNDLLAYNAGRNLGLLATDLFSPFKNILSKRSLGISGQTTKLVRGIPL